MRKARWLAEWAGKQGKPAIYHCISRVVDRRFVFGDEEREKFRIFMRMQENFTGCRVLTYCVMSNHFHILLEVPPVPEGGVSDELLLKRLAALYSEAFVDGVAQELEDARKEEDYSKGQTKCVESPCDFDIGGQDGCMRKARWLAEWAGKQGKPAIYHCISRVVDRRYVFGDEEREKFRIFMRMQENFTGCRVLTYCVMSNHFHVLLEVPPAPEGGISDDILLKRLAALYSEAFVDGVSQELEIARKVGDEEMVAEIRARFTYRMNDLSEFMKTLLQRFTRWFNREHSRRGTLWEERYKSVIVESGVAARTMAAYIDLNPVRAGMVSDPADYRWSGYGEAVSGGAKGNGKKAKYGLILTVRNPETRDQIAMDSWKEVSRVYRRAMGLALVRKSGRAGAVISAHATMNEVEYLEGATEDRRDDMLPDLRMAGMLSKRVRYFTDGAVIGSKAFVNEAFDEARQRFTERRKDGARRMRGSGAAAKGVLWSVRDLRVGV